MKLTLAYAPIACSLVPFITLTEAGADFDLLPVNLSKGENENEAYRKLNPKMKVPTLIIDGKPLTENIAIQLWIARMFPHAKLLPADPMQEMQAISVLSWCSSGIHPKLTQQARPERYCDLPGSAASVRALGSHSLFDNFAIADEMLAGREWFFDHFTTADAYFFWCFRRGSLFEPDVSGFQNCMAHFERMKQRPSVQMLLAREKQVQAQFAAAG